MRNVSFLLLVASATLLSSCSPTIREMIGLNKSAPDEFAIIAAPPLTVPSSFDLPDPQKAETPSMAQSKIREEAKDVLLSQGKAGSNPAEPATDRSALTQGKDLSSGAPVKAVEVIDESTSGGESALLTRAGAKDANPEIKNILQEESPPVPVNQEKGFFDKLQFWKNTKKETQPVVDAATEKDRIRDSVKNGQTVTGEGAASVVPHDKGLLEKWLDF